LSIEVEKYKIKTLKLEESLDSALALSDNGIPPLLGNELLDLFHFCQKRSFKMGNTLKNVKKDIDEDSCMTVLRLVRKGINMQSKKIVELEGRGGDIPENEQMSRISNLEIELRVALKANDDVRALKMKLMQMVEKTRNEKDIRTRNEEDLFMNKKKMLMLSDHMEKLMNHLKLEATNKLKTVELLRLSERSNRKLQEKIDILTRKNSAKDRLILELREGSKILEDQLRLIYTYIYLYIYIYIYNTYMKICIYIYI
jgi:hypothetical protein